VGLLSLPKQETDTESALCGCNTMSFKFNFITADEGDCADINAGKQQHLNDKLLSTSLILPEMHTVSSLLFTLPRNIVYSFASTTQQLPRRELYDVRMQLMAEDKDLTIACNDSVTNISLGGIDIRERVYEGGLKSWECSHDLVTYLSQDLESNEYRPYRVLELGCGTALPSLLLFRQMLAGGKAGELMLADYNYDVLRLVTLPNLFLTWAVTTQRLEEGMTGGKGECDASADLRAEFLLDLQRRGIILKFISGAWGEGMLQLIGLGVFDLVIGSETIYSPSSMPDFTEVLLRSLKSQGRALVAAKRIYFGVGGSVEDFVEAVEKHPDCRVRTTMHIEEVGVGRVIIEVVKKL
jgi:protein-histidine N-methyltransferase